MPNSSTGTYITGLGEIASYRGNFPSPLQVMWYVPENDEIFKIKISDSEIRRWIKDAADYHNIPHALLALILQQENAPNAPTWRKIGQFGERTLTTFAAILDENLWDIVPDKISGGSSGFANMSRKTLRGAASYIETEYNKEVLPDNVKYRFLGLEQDTRIPGDDWKADLYYCAAHLRQLIDRVTGQARYNGQLSIEQVRKVTYYYNGSGSMAEKYSQDAMRLLENAANGAAILYFYEK